jgi:hypothetical protein
MGKSTKMGSRMEWGEESDMEMVYTMDSTSMVRERGMEDRYTPMAATISDNGKIE